jgi:hypothetical protein
MHVCVQAGMPEKYDSLKLAQIVSNIDLSHLLIHSNNIQLAAMLAGSTKKRKRERSTNICYLLSAGATYQQLPAMQSRLDMTCIYVADECHHHTALQIKRRNNQPTAGGLCQAPPGGSRHSE